MSDKKDKPSPDITVIDIDTPVPAEDEPTEYIDIPVTDEDEATVTISDPVNDESTVTISVTDEDSCTRSISQPTVPLPDDTPTTPRTPGPSQTDIVPGQTPTHTKRSGNWMLWTAITVIVGAGAGIGTWLLVSHDTPKQPSAQPDPYQDATTDIAESSAKTTVDDVKPIPGLPNDPAVAAVLTSY